MATLKRWLWRAAMGICAILALFFAVMAVVPLNTVGDPVFDTVMLRTRYWGGSGLGIAHLVAIPIWAALMLLAGSWRRALFSLLALAATAFGLFAIMHEYGSLIEYGDLRDPSAIAAHKLRVSRLLTLGAALVAVFAGWYARPKAASPKSG
jgi:hypothetical protein